MGPLRPLKRPSFLCPQQSPLLPLLRPRVQPLRRPRLLPPQQHPLLSSLLRPERLPLLRLQQSPLLRPQRPSLLPPQRPLLLCPQPPQEQRPLPPLFLLPQSQPQQRPHQGQAFRRTARRTGRQQRPHPPLPGSMTRPTRRSNGGRFNASDEQSSSLSVTESRDDSLLDSIRPSSRPSVRSSSNDLPAQPIGRTMPILPDASPSSSSGTSPAHSSTRALAHRNAQ